MAKAISSISFAYVMFIVCGFVFLPHAFPHVLEAIGLSFWIWFCTFIIALHFLFTEKGGTSEFKESEVGTPVGGEYKDRSTSCTSTDWMDNKKDTGNAGPP